MGRGDYLGEFEQVVLLAVARLREEAYGMRVRAEIETRAGRASTIGAVYATLERLVSKGYARESEQPGGEERSGLARRFYEITPAGRAALEQTRALQTRMWSGLKLRPLRRRP
ncbi:MAG: helix-turn-helix transcriptional regulator [Vicinamibacterales bacterium]